MIDASTSEGMSPQLLKVAERAKNEPEGKFHSLAHLITTEALTRAFRRLRNNAAVGVDGVTKEQYGEALEENLGDLLARMKAKQYRHQPIRRVHIPKGKGTTRPIGISTVEDKVVQGAVREVLEAIYEQDFLDCSHGYRPGRSAHDAIRALNRMGQEGETNWLLEADITAFFDSIDRKMLMEMLQLRVADTSLLRLIGKCLHVGVLEGEERTDPEDGTAQGSVISPILGNIYLHYVLDRWFEEEVKPRLRGKATLLRYVDDFVIGFENREDAERVMKVLHQRMNKYRLTLHPDKTRLIAFGRTSNGDGGGRPPTFDFLGFTHYLRRTRSGTWTVGCKTKRGSLRRAISAVDDWCRSHRHLEVKEQHAALVLRIEGHFNYFGVNGNTPSLAKLDFWAQKAWHKWLNRRSQRARMTWERFTQLVEKFPLPVPRVKVQIWKRATP
jgi:RNA-directed DNA polymerase